MTPGNQNRTTQLTASRMGARLFRMNSGLAWIGEVIEKTQSTITLKNPRPFRAGVPGISDNGGWVTVTITPEMVGQKIAVSTWVEDKSGTGRANDLQKAFIRAVRAAGGRAGVARGEADVIRILNGEDTPL